MVVVSDEPGVVLTGMRVDACLHGELRAAAAAGLIAAPQSHFQAVWVWKR